MQRALWLTLTVASGLAGALAGLGADKTQQTLSPHIRQADNLLEQMRAILGEVTALQAQAPAEPATLLDCIHARTLKIKGLVEVMESAHTELLKAVAEEDRKRAEAIASTMRTALVRAENHLAEARQCTGWAKPAEAETPPAMAEPATSPAVRVVEIMRRPARPKRRIQRDDSRCLSQDQLARLLARAMQVQIDDVAAPEEWFAKLAELTVEPLGGWRAGKCATVDDVCVTAARAMRLKVADPDQPESYVQALRNEGLAVDTLLPERPPEGPSPYVVESEVRAFFASGYAAPLPSAQRIDPD